MNTLQYKQKPVLATLICSALISTTHAQFLWSERIASATSLPSNEPNLGLALDASGNCYVTGWFDGTNNFGGVTLTNQSVGGSDIFVTKYNSSGALQWVQQAGESAGNVNYGRAVGVDADGNIYITGGYSGPAQFGGANLPDPGTQSEAFFLAKYNSTGSNQWVKNAISDSGRLYGIGLAVDGAGSVYALAFGYGAGESITFGKTNVSVPADYGESTFLVKYDNTGTVKWAQLLGGSAEVYADHVAVDASGYVYVSGSFTSDLTITAGNGISHFVGSASSQNSFIAKFNNSGTLIWVEQPQGSSAGGSEVVVDTSGNVYSSGGFANSINFGGGVSLTNSGTYTAFIAEYNGSGTIQWARQAAGASVGQINGIGVDGVYFGVALDAQDNVYAAGTLISGAAVSKYSAGGTWQWTYAANSPDLSPMGSMAVKCAVDSTGHCLLAGWYQGTNTFGTSILKPQETWNLFLASVETVTNPTVLFTATPISGFPPLTVQFNSTNVDSSSNTIANWRWDFGDGTLTNSQNPTHVYTNIGTYSPSFVATNSKDVEVLGYGPQIVVTNLTVQYITSVTNGVAPLTVQFSSQSSDSLGNVISTWNWCFGDGGVSTNENPTHTYTNCASFTPILMATNRYGVAVIGYGPRVFVLATNFSFITNNGTLQISRYLASSGNVMIPSTINGLAVTGIGAYAFQNCSLTNVVIPGGVTSIGDSAFAGCSGLTSIAIPNSVTNIGSYAFFSCLGLTNLAFGNGIADIGHWAFNSCSSLTSVAIPKSVANIGDGAFSECSSLTNILADGSNMSYSTAEGVLFNKLFTILIQYPIGIASASYAIPRSVTRIGDSAFSSCTNLMSVIIPDSVTNIEASAFWSCSLTNLTLDNSLTSIGDTAFGDCIGLISVTIPNSVGSIGDWAFGYCVSLTNLVLGDGITNIGCGVFASCSSLTSVTIPDNVINIGDSEFSDCGLTNITIPNSVNSIGEGAFDGCSSLTSVTIPNRVTNIGSYAFMFCSSLTNVVLGDGITSVNDGTFKYCSGLMNIIIPNNVTDLGDMVFCGCTGLSSVTIPNSITTMGDYAFAICSALTNVTIPSSVAAMGSDVFYRCSSLTHAYFQGNAPTVDGGVGSGDITVFSGESGTAYFLAGTTGWDSTFGGWPTAAWYQPQPQIFGSGYGLGEPSNQFNFTISWATNASVVVQACTNLSHPVWTPLVTNALVSGTNCFSDPKWTNYPSRFYRVTTP